jgi:hypothetical protein
LFIIGEIKPFDTLFADDAVFFAHTPEALQSMLNDLQLYCFNWGVTINTKKTKIVIFKQGRHSSYDFRLNNGSLEIVTQRKYLGVTLLVIGIASKNLLSALSIIFFLYSIS